MPELPEVETVVRNLRPVLVGRRILGVRCSRKKLRQTWRSVWNQHLIGQQVQALRRRGKYLLADLDEGCLLMHLGMTGRLQIMSSDLPQEPHTHLIFPLSAATRSRSPEELRFSDPRRFGLAQYGASAEIPLLLGEARLGPEPFDLTTDAFHAKLKGTQRCLKAVLLDQRVLAGVGNIYADEALFAAQLHPQRRGCDLTWAEADRLRTRIVDVLEKAIALQGSTFLSFVYGNGERGNYQHEFQAYQRTGEPCSRCGMGIRQIVLAGRSTHYCPRCQTRQCRTRRK